MKQFVKATFNSLIGHIGLEIHRRDQPVIPPFVPFVREFSNDQVSFRYWVTSPLYCEWYDPAVWFRSPEAREIARLVQPGDRVLEIGANVGFTTCLLASLVGQSGHVTAVELVPANCLAAHAQIGLNGFQNIEVLQFAASDSSDTLNFENKENGEVVSTSSPTAAAAQPDLPPVAARPCDELLATHGPFDLVKIDCEGFEGRVLRGSRSILASRPRLAIEIHGGETLTRHGSSVDEVFSLIDAAHYSGSCWIEDESSARPFDLASHPRHMRSHVFLSPRD